LGQAEPFANPCSLKRGKGETAPAQRAAEESCRTGAEGAVSIEKDPTDWRCDIVICNFSIHRNRCANKNAVFID